MKAVIYPTSCCATPIGHATMRGMSPASSAPGFAVSVQPGAEPYAADGGPVGVLVCHGFTGSPRTVRPWAEYLAAAGLTVRAPRLP